jgi:hypothetical protein
LDGSLQPKIIDFGLSRSGEKKLAKKSFRSSRTIASNEILRNNIPFDLPWRNQDSPKVENAKSESTPFDDNSKELIRPLLQDEEENGEISDTNENYTTMVQNKTNSFF